MYAEENFLNISVQMLLINILNRLQPKPNSLCSLLFSCMNDHIVEIAFVEIQYLKMNVQ